MSAISEDEESLDEAVNEFAISRRQLRDEETGLYYHAWNEQKQQEWVDPDTGLSRYFWSRGMAGLGFGRDGSYRYYMSEPVMNNDPKGKGPFIMAGIQVSQMHRDH